MAGTSPPALLTAIFGFPPRGVAHWNALGLFYQIPGGFLECPAHLIAHCPIYRTSVLYLGQASDLVLAVFRISTPLGTYLIVFLGTNCI